MPLVNFLAVCPQSSFLTSYTLSFSVYERKTIMTTLPGCYKDKFHTVCIVLYVIY